MKTLRNAVLVIATGAALTACVPPSVSLKVASTAPDATPGSSATINIGEAAVLSWTGTSKMPGTDGQTISRDYSIESSDTMAAKIKIAENCTATSLNTDWTCVKAARSGTANATPIVSGTYTLNAKEQLYTSVAGVPVPLGKEVSKQAVVSVTVNADVAISTLLPLVTDTALRTCISDTATASGATMTSQLVSLYCNGLNIKKLGGLPYFQYVLTLDLSNNAIQTVEGDSLRYMTAATSVNLQQSGLTCTKQKAIQSALTSATVLVGQGASTCP